MDENKLEKLQEIDYKIQKACALCAHGVFGAHNNDWGVCVKFTYKHKKHTNTERHLSVYRYGSCPAFLYDHDRDMRKELGPWKEFVSNA